LLLLSSVVVAAIIGGGIAPGADPIADSLKLLCLIDFNGGDNNRGHNEGKLVNEPLDKLNRSLSRISGEMEGDNVLPLPPTFAIYNGDDDRDRDNDEDNSDVGEEVAVVAVLIQSVIL